jgi:hypothetical protein
MNETLLTDVMNEATADVRISPDLLSVAQRRHRRRKLNQRAVASVGVAVVAGGAVVATNAHAPVGHHVSAKVVSHPQLRSAAYITKRLTAGLADENDFLITSNVSGAGHTMTAWLDPTTGNRRLLLNDGSGAPEIETGAVVHGDQVTLTTVDYDAHTVAVTHEPLSVIDSSSRLGVNVPTPSQIKAEIGRSTLVDEGQTSVDGHNVYQLRLTAPSPAGSEIWAAGTAVELYVDTTTYQLIRTTVSDSGSPLYADDLTWTPRGSADLNKTAVEVPKGFTVR